MIAIRKAAKYVAYARVTVRSHLAYVPDFLIRSAFLVVILFIFFQLWSVTYGGVGESVIGGYTFEQMIWYLAVAESVILASPKLNAKVEAEVKNGDIAYQLTRPASYLLLHYGSYMGEAAVRVVVNLALGSALAMLWFGWQTPGWNVPLCLLVMAGSFTVNFLLTMLLSLAAFWVEETRGLDFVYNKLLFTVGGMLLPLEMFPDALRSVSEWLPFQTVAYFAAKTAVRPEAAETVRMIAIQWGWAALLAAAAAFVYRKGVRKLNVNGG
ncbi:ABC transporter permease [Paenibacillus flagellatus]|uniref:ABC transporter permease n=1 Tax=Paenibacillus flagellatus TaxID=2211139 RepID=A0A2V5KIV7_9BACL|nr:ABC-2 family transporter protein [Paenibacillus flagellatus]PYI54480.1 ABC transporter permease [Paenibacillus flagellatus]